MDEAVADALHGWQGEMGTAWARRNPVLAKDTDKSWRIRFGHTKTVFVRELLKGVVPDGTDWVDVGCGGGAHMHTMAAAGQQCVHGCDVSEGALKQATLGHLRVGDARELPYDDQSFDGVTTSGTLMHVGGEEGLVQAMDEFRRVARRFIFCVELWQPHPMMIDFKGLMPHAWVYPWERVVPHLLGSEWTMERCRLVRSCGRVKRVQPLMAVLMVREKPMSKFGLWE